MSAPDATTDPELEAVAWDLAPLLDDGGDDPVRRRRRDARRPPRRAPTPSPPRTPARWTSSTGRASSPLMRELGELQELAGRAGSYAILNFSGNTADPARGALLQRMQEKATAIETALLFFELEWAALDDDRAEELLATEGLDFARHHLRSARRYRPHLLSEPEERIFSERALTGRTAWTRLFEEQASAITVELPDATEPVSLEVAMARLFSPDRELRRDTAERVTTALAARPAHARVRVQHAAGGQDGRGPAALVPELAGQPQPLQRGLRRVRAGARRGGPRPLRGAAPLVPAEGAAARGRQARRLRPAGARLRRTRSTSAGARRATSCSTPTARSRASSADLASASSTSAGSAPMPRMVWQAEQPFARKRSRPCAASESVG